MNPLQKILGKTVSWSRATSKTPWASFEVVGFEKDGKIKVICSWNKSFIKQIHSLGFHAETEEDSVQLFFYTAQARPTEFDGEVEGARSSEHPNLSNDTHFLRT